MFDSFEFENPSPDDWLKYCQGKLRKHPPGKKRWLLHSKVRIANQLFDCHQCYIPICPGDQYLEEVYACTGKIEVKRSHYPECPHDPWDDEDEESFKDESDDTPQTVPLPVYTATRQAA